MAEISAQMVKALRERTGAGMMDCKRALVEANGDMALAEVILRKKGIAAATKKEGRSTKQGVIASHISDNGKTGVLVEVNCESDFVARTDDFLSLTADIAAHIAKTKPKYVRAEELTQQERAQFKAHEALYEQKFAHGQNTTIGELVKTKIAKLGENIAVSRFTIYEANGTGVVSSYIHHGAQIGALLEMKVNSDATAAKEDFRILLHDLAMQIAAAHPQYVSREEIPADILAQERNIQRERALGEGKPEKMVDKIAEGRMSKFYEEICLLDQPFIRENSVSVTELIRTVGAKLGESLTVTRFIRYKVGDAADAAGVEASPLPVTA